MFRPIFIDPALFQITIVVISLLAISMWQKLKTTSGIVIAVYAIYMISFVSANSKLKTSQPIHLAIHEIKYSNEPKQPDAKLSSEDSNFDNITNLDEEKKGNASKTITNVKSKEVVKKINKAPQASKQVNLSTNDIPFKVLRMKTGTSIINRSIVNENDSFTTDVDRVYFLSGVQNQNDSKVLFHKWYHGGRLKSKIKMESKKSYNWRSWSYITVNPNKKGSWQVVIEDQGGIRYDSLSFVINDYNI